MTHETDYKQGIQKMPNYLIGGKSDHKFAVDGIMPHLCRAANYLIKSATWLAGAGRLFGGVFRLGVVILATAWIGIVCAPAGN